MRAYRPVKHRGKWCVEYYDDLGIRHRPTTGTDDRALADQIIPRIIAALERPAGRVWTVAEIWDRCRADKEAQGQVTATNMKFHWVALESFFGNKSPDAITIQDCRTYGAQRLEQGKSIGTVVAELKHLRLALGWARKHSMIQATPFVEVPSSPEPRDRYLTRSEFERLYDCAIMPHIQLSLELLIATGARVDAILGLTWSRVDLERRKIHLADPFTSRRMKGRASIMIQDDLLPVLVTAHQNRTCEFVIERGGDRLKSIRRGIDSAAKRAGLEGVSPHVIRHTAAVWMAEDNVPMEEIAQYLGHRDVNTTRKVYARFSPEHLAKAGRSLSWRTRAEREI
ncbi:site-specific integrase [Breoghania sp. L-A4]|uniref:tyrosine-type recombinase/integrase n=1 Tax=Breoghania sp. L-A4 TaxID=2304600 RepID=UPI000E35886B|nr:site-specific integrase [Breoghania sp. L-A4]AXS41004.1 site-specific integrase [Breoghania sp. L-A4]